MHTPRSSFLVGFFLVGSFLMGCGLEAAPEVLSADSVATSRDALEGGPALAFAPVAVRTSPSTFDVFAPADDGRVWTRRFDENERTFGDWQRLESTSLPIGSSLSAVVDASGAVRLFTRHFVVNGVSTMQVRRTGATWAIVSDWRIIPFGMLLSRDAPAAVVDSAGITHLFAVRADTRELAKTSCSNVADCASAVPTWAPWVLQSLLVHSAPTVLAAAPGEFDAWFQGRDGRVREAHFGPRPYPYAPNWSTPFDTGASEPMRVFAATTGTSAPWTLATALSVDGRQGVHPLRNVRTNALGESNFRGTCGGNGAEAVLRLDLPQEARVQLDTAGADFDTVVYVRDASNAEVVDPLGTVGCNDDFNFTLQSALDLRLRAGTYYVFVDGYGAGSTNANRFPPVNVTITNISAPSAVRRVVDGVTLTDVYSVGFGGKLAVATRNGAAWSGWRVLEALDPVVTWGDLSESIGVSAVLSSKRPGCSHVFMREPGTRTVFEKGCTRALVSLDNHGGLSWSTPLVPTLLEDPFNHEWGQLNSAWNSSMYGSVSVPASSTVRVGLTASWPAELYALDFSDFRSDWEYSWAAAGDAHAWAALSSKESFDWWLAPGGAVYRTTELPMTVGTLRLVDHGACSTRIPWTDDLPYSSPHTGLLNQLQRVLNDSTYLGAATAMSSVSNHWSAQWLDNRFTPSFSHFSGDPRTGNHSDGFMFHNRVRLEDGWMSLEVGAAGHYVLGLVRGAPSVHTLSAHGFIDPSFTYGASFFAWNWHWPWRSPLGEGICDSKSKDEKIACLMHDELPVRLRGQFLAQMTAVLGDPMAMAACATPSDCTTGDASGWACVSGRCMVPIAPGAPGYLEGAYNYRTEYDVVASTPLLSNCAATAPDEPLDPFSLAQCQTVLTGALVNKGVDLATAEAWARDPSMVANRQFGCVVPPRPNCTPGLVDIPGYRCMDNDEPKGTGRFDPGTTSRGRCTWRPAMKRLVVSPQALELVWTEAGEAPSLSEKIVRTLAPASACSEPAPQPLGVVRAVPSASFLGSF